MPIFQAIVACPNSQRIHNKKKKKKTWEQVKTTGEEQWERLGRETFKEWLTSLLFNLSFCCLAFHSGALCHQHSELWSAAKWNKECFHKRKHWVTVSGVTRSADDCRGCEVNNLGKGAQLYGPWTGCKAEHYKGVPVFGSNQLWFMVKQITIMIIKDRVSLEPTTPAGHNPEGCITVLNHFII